MKTEMAERRVRRSSNPSEALVCWLEAVRHRLSLRSVALADSLGMLVAGAGPARECDELAAWAPLSDSAPFRMALARVPGFDAYVCAQSDALEALATAAAGCSRILLAPA
ncbi:MAG: hypothetical protein QM756_30305 [Polyangiaceae bacterium]